MKVYFMTAPKTNELFITGEGWKLTKARKVDLLYKKAKGQSTDAAPAEIRELKKYKVEFNEGKLYATKANISAYVSAVDNGFRRSFYDWCIDNRKADKRRSGSSAEEIGGADRERSLSAMVMGWLTWGVAVYWIFHGTMTVGSCAVIGAVISFFLYRFARQYAILTVWILPLALAAIFGHGR